MAQDDPRRGPERRGLARELIEAWAQRDPGPPPMTPERLAHTRRKRFLQVLVLIWLLINSVAFGIWATEPVDTSLTEFWPAWIAVITALPLAVVGLFVFARRPIKETSIQGSWRSGRGVITVLFTDIVSSTERARGLGDRRWPTGDGILATFDSPGRAINAARDLREEVRSMGIDVRAGIHTGEVERRGADVGGIGVHIAARVMGTADPGQILVSRTVRDLIAGPTSP